MPMIANEASTLQTAVHTALTSVQADALAMIGDVVPVALTIVGAVMVVTIGIKVFKKISGRA